MKKFGEGQQPFHAVIDIPEGDSQELTTVTDQALNSLYGELFNLLQTHGINPTATTSADLKQVARAVWSAVNAGSLFIDIGTANVKNLTHFKGEKFLFKNGNSGDNGFIIEFLNKVENTGEVIVNVFDAERNENHFNGAKLVDTAKRPLSAKFLPANSMVKAYYEYDNNQFVIINIYNSTTTDSMVLNAENLSLRSVNVTAVESVASLLDLNKINGRTIFVKSYHAGLNKGGGTRIYDSAKANINDGGLCINGWVLQDVTQIDVYMFGAKGDSVTDDTTAFKNAAASGKALNVPDGDYIVNDSIDFGEKMHVDFSPNAKIIANGSYSKEAVFVAKGNAQQTTTLSANAVKGALSIMLTNTTGLQSGDLLCIFNPTNGSWSKFRDNYKAGEFVLVSSVSGNTINLTKPLFDSYNIGDVDIYKITPCSVNLNNPNIESNGSALGLIKAEYALNPVVNNPKLLNSNNNCLAFIRSVNGNINGGDIRNYGNGGDDYGLVFGNSQGFTVKGGNYYARRHATASGGDADLCCVPCRDIKYSDCDISNDINSGVFSADMHGNAEFVRYVNCRIANGVTLQGANNDLIDNHIYGGILGGSVIYTAEILGGKFDIKGNTFECFKDPSDTNRGVVDFGGNNSSIDNRTTRDTLINFDNNTVNSDKFSAITNIITVRNRGTDKKININSQHNTLNVNALNAMLYIDKISGTAKSDFIIVDNNQCNKSGMYSIYPDADYTALSKLRCQSTVWSNTVSVTTASGSMLAGEKTFAWRFPYNPMVTVTHTGGVNFDSYSTNAKPINVTNKKADIYLNSGDPAKTFPINATVTVSGRAEIKEV